MNDIQELLDHLNQNINSVADSITALKYINDRLANSLHTTNIFLGIISVSLISLVIIKIYELKKIKK